MILYSPFFTYFFFCAHNHSPFFFFFFSSRRRHTRSDRDWSSDVCSSDLVPRSAQSCRRQRRFRVADICITESTLAAARLCTTRDSHTACAEARWKKQLDRKSGV